MSRALNDMPGHRYAPGRNPEADKSTIEVVLDSVARNPEALIPFAMVCFALVAVRSVIGRL